MARYSSNSFLKKSLTALFISSLMFLSASASSYYGEAPNAPPPSNAFHPRVCYFDNSHVMGGYRDFRDLEGCDAGFLRTCEIGKIYQLGDSISDVGNLAREGPVRAAAPFARLPYGADFPTGPTGRASNGNLMIDYFALDAGLPLLPPYKKSDADFSHGVNFAVAGSTALPWDVLASMNISSPLTNTSLSVQIDWLSNHINSIVSIEFKIQTEVLILGPFGGSDYEYALSQGKSVQEIETTLIPKVVEEIMSEIRRLPFLAIRIVLIPGLYTISGKAFSKESEELVIRHNTQLRQAIEESTLDVDTYTLIAYLDYFSAYQTLQRYTASDGHIMDEKVCCGSGGGEYNFDSRRRCGAEGVVACSDPGRHISWDGINLTQEAYRIMSKYIMYHMNQILDCPSP